MRLRSHAPVRAASLLASIWLLASAGALGSTAAAQGRPGRAAPRSHTAAPSARPAARRGRDLLQSWWHRAKRTGSALGRSRARRRLHVVTPELRRRLAPETRRVVSAVGAFLRPDGSAGGTAFLISEANAAGEALVMTNEHVIRGYAPAKTAIRFLGEDGATQHRAEVVAVVAQSRRRDYAVLRVKVPDELAGRAPIRLAAEPHRGRVYNVGFPRLSLEMLAPRPERRVSVHLPPGKHEEPGGSVVAPIPMGGIERRLRRMMGVRTGVVLTAADELRRYDAVTAPTAAAIGVGQSMMTAPTGQAFFKLPGTGGNSGSPIVASDSHEMVALHSVVISSRRMHLSSLRTQFSRTSAGQTSVALLAHLRSALKRGRIDPAHRSLLREVVAPAAEATGSAAPTTPGRGASAAAH